MEPTTVWHRNFPQQPGPVEGAPAHGKGVGMRRSLKSLLTQRILCFCEYSRACYIYISTLVPRVQHEYEKRQEVAVVQVNPDFSNTIYQSHL